MRTVSQILKDQNKQIKIIPCVDIINSLGIKTQKRNNHFVAMCPLHNDKNTPSLTIYPSTNSWCCFSSSCFNPKYPGKINGGSHIDFIMQYKQCDYSQAIRWIKQQFNLSTDSKCHKPEKNSKTQYLIGYDDIAYYHSLLSQNGKREYFYKRGFTDITIDREMFGFDGQSYIIPIWEHQPRKSSVLSIKKRQNNGPKYVRLGDYEASIYGLWYCKMQPIIFAFAGELDCALANQYSLPSFSLINGANGWKRLSEDWPSKLFPDTLKLIVVFDRKEEVVAGAMASSWEKVKGRFTATVIHYPPDFEGSDFNDFILQKGIDTFYNVVNWSSWWGQQK